MLNNFDIPSVAKSSDDHFLLFSFLGQTLKKQKKSLSKTNRGSKSRSTERGNKCHIVSYTYLNVNSSITLSKKKKMSF